MTTDEILQSIEANVKSAYTSLENKRATIPANKNIENLSIAVDSIKPLLEDVNVNPTTSTQIFTATGDNDGIGKVTVNPVTKDIDANIIPTNIRKGKTILGVVGNLEVDKPDQTKTVTPKTTAQEVVADTGYELAKVTINAVTRDIDSNIQASNIKQGVSILGVAGTFEGGIRPTGTIDISENGSYDVSNYATANVNVSTIEEETDATTYVCRVFDYDGTIIKEEEHKSGETFTLPDLPSHDGLVAQGWSSVANIVDNKVVVDDEDIIIGVNYITNSGMTEFDISLTKVTGLSVTLKMDGVKDWGDGTSDSSNTHTYTAYGDYTIKCDGTQIMSEPYLGVFGQDDAKSNYYGKSVRFGNISVVPEYSFYNCKSLQYVTFSNSIKTVNNCFGECASLGCVAYPQSASSIILNHEGNNSLRHISMPTISDMPYYGTFKNCYALEYITMPKVLTTIKQSAFSNCYNLKRLKVPEGVTATERDAFYLCKSMISLVLPSTITSIAVMSSCYALKELILDENSSATGSFSISNCYSLRHVPIPQGTTSVTLKDCNLVDALVIPAGVTKVTISNCASLYYLELPDSVKELSVSKCDNIYKLILNQGITKVYMSDMLSLRDINLPNTITEVSFVKCPSMFEYDFSEFPEMAVTVEADGFNGINPITKILVPKNLDIDNWLKTDPSFWFSYKDYIYKKPSIPSTITVTVNNYLGELVSGASVTITDGANTYTGTTNDDGVYVQNNLQPATYTISVADLEGFETPEAVDVVVEENTQNSVTITYLEQIVVKIDPVFGNNSPEVISAVGDEIATKGYTSSQVEEIYGWKLGDTVSYTLSTGENVEMRIIGFNHDDLSSGKGKAGITLEMTHSLRRTYAVDNTDMVGGYPATDVKVSTMPAIKATIPQEWQDIIKPVDKKSANGGNTYTETVTSSEELFLLSEIEVFGTVVYAMAGETEGSIYEYYVGKTDAGRVKYRDTGGDYIPDKPGIWWLRSCVYNYKNVACYVSDTGQVGYQSCYNQGGVSFAFCVGAPTTFADYTPSEISEISAEISAKNMTSAEVQSTYGWKIGDTTSYQLTTGENVEMRIIGFNHDDKADGTGKAGITLEMTHCLKQWYVMEPKGINGYPTSEMKTTTLPAIKATIPQEWQDVIKLVNKTSADGGGVKYTEMLTTSEDLFLLGEYEVFGLEGYGKNSAAEGSQYEYWINNNNDSSRIKYYDSDSDGTLNKTGEWWLRSSAHSNNSYFVYVENTGTRKTLNANSTYANRVSYAFCI